MSGYIIIEMMYDQRLFGKCEVGMEDSVYEYYSNVNAEPILSLIHI